MAGTAPWLAACAYGALNVHAPALLQLLPPQCTNQLAQGLTAEAAAERTGEGVRELGRTEPERPRVGAAAGGGERDSCCLRARNSCCSGLRPPAGAAADELAGAA